MKINILIKDGVQPNAVLKDCSLGESGRISIKKLINPVYAINSYKQKHNSVDDYDNDEDFFLKNIYPLLNEEEKRIHRLYTVEFSDSINATDLLENLRKSDLIDFAEINHKYFLIDNNSVKTDTSLCVEALPKELWNLERIKCSDAWNFSEGDNVIIGVVDTGVDYNHPDIKNKMWHDSQGNCGYNFWDNNTDPMDIRGHGTHVAGTIAGNHVGVAPNSRIMALKIFGADGTDDSLIINAWYYAITNGAVILNNSWGPDKPYPSDPTLETGLRYVVSQGCTAVFAAGNNNDDVSQYSPANCPEAIAVAAVDNNDKRASFSCYGDLVTCAAPGENIISLKYGTSDYCEKSGTSMATPHVCGIIALLLSINPTMSPKQIKNRLKSYGDVISVDKPIGKISNSYKFIFPIDLSDTANWNKPQYYKTIQGADVDGDGKNELLARGCNGILAWKRCDHDWTMLPTINYLNDEGNWNEPQYYETIQCSDIDGDGEEELLARGFYGVQTWKFKDNNWIELPILNYLNDEGNWNKPQYYETIQCADIDGDGQNELLARGFYGVQTWKFKNNNWTELPILNYLDDEGNWNKPQYYKTIQCADVDGDGKDELVARGFYGVQTWKFKDNNWIELPILSYLNDEGNWNKPQYYETIQCADIDGDGKKELLARGYYGVQTWKLTDNGWTELPIINYLSDEGNWNKPEYYRTIQCADIDGDGSVELLARGYYGIQTWKYVNNKWTELETLCLLNNKNGWNKPEYYDTIQCIDLDGDRKAELVARGASGVLMWKYDGSAFKPFC